MRGYVEAAVARGDPVAILRREILPNVSSTILADAGPRFTVSILLIAAVNFLGLGLDPPAADWSLMISENRAGITINPWAVLAPAIVIGLLTVAHQRARRRAGRDARHLRGRGGAAGDERPGAGDRRPDGDHQPRRPVLDAVSLRLGRAESLGVVGESGSGKTTLAHAILGFCAPRRCASRPARCGSWRRLLGLPERELRTLRGGLVAYVPQDPATALNPSMRIGAQIAVGRCTPPGPMRRRSCDRARPRRTAVGPAVPRRFPHELSGGQQQRVAIGMALCCDPPLVVLDEPTTGLDVVTQARILDELRVSRRSGGRTRLRVPRPGGRRRRGRPRRRHVRGPPRRAGPRGRRDRAAPPSLCAGARLERARPPDPRGPSASPGGDGRGERAGRLPLRRPLLASHRRVRRRAAPARAGRPRPRGAVPALARTPPPVATPRLASAGPHRPDAAARGRRRERRASAPRGDHAVVARRLLRARAGECVALVGESGSGKTTIARCIAGLHARVDGRIRFEGESLAGSARRPDARAAAPDPDRLPESRTAR